MAGALYSIDLELDFMAETAKLILAEEGRDIDSLSDTLVFVQGSGARQGLIDAFLNLSDGAATLLPRIITLGDIVGENEALPPPLGSLDPPAVIDSLSRQGQLAKIIADMGPAIVGSDLSATQVWQLAKALGDLIDEFDMAGVERSDLKHLVPDDLAHHWQQSLELLNIVFDTWPAIRNRMGGQDNEKARAEILDHIAQHFAEDNEHTALYIAGTTGTRPSVRQFISRLYTQANATVILPGVDLDIPDDLYEDIDPSHPQWAMRQLLRAMAIDRAEVKSIDPKEPMLRVSLFQSALAPSRASENWFKDSFRTIAPETLYSGVRLVEASGRREEAAAIALALREIVATKSKTGLLVTHDRSLAALVQQHLKIWDIAIDDAAGIPLSSLPEGRFIQAVAEAMISDFKPVALLSMLIHPLSACGMPRDSVRQATRLIDKKLLRGPRPPKGLYGIKERAKKLKDDAEKTLCLSLLDWLIEHATIFDDTSKRSVRDILADHLRFAEKVAVEDGLTTGDSARRVHERLEKLYHGLPGDWLISPKEYPALLNFMLQSDVARLQRDSHPRIRIVGPRELRHASADLIILGGMNEDSWPAAKTPDPWLNKKMRHDLKLPPEDQQIGQAAHDFLTAASKHQVLLTRSLKVDGSPTVMSRWLYRIEALAVNPIPRDTTYQNWLRFLDSYTTPEAELVEASQTPSIGDIRERTKSTEPPRPKPPMAARPKRLSVSDIQLWMRDPYALYAKRILGLKPLDILDADPSAADKGTLLHDALERFLKEDGAITGPKALERLQQLGREVFQGFDDLPTVSAFWWPRFESLAQAFIDHGDTWWKSHQNLLVERDGIYRLPTIDFTVHARADRIDVNVEGYAVVIDYKTGQIPTGTQIAAGFAPQLPLEGLILSEGGFEGVGAVPVSDLAYWIARGGKNPLDFKDAAWLSKKDSATLIAEAKAGLTALAMRFEKPSTPYLSNPRPGIYGMGDYDHLARVKEWRDKASLLGAPPASDDKQEPQQ